MSFIDTIEKLTLEEVQNAQHLVLRTHLHTDEPKTWILSRKTRRNYFEWFLLPDHAPIITVEYSAESIVRRQNRRGTTLDVLLNFPEPTALELLEAAVGDADAFVFRDHMGSAHAALRLTESRTHLFRIFDVGGSIGLESILEMFQPDIGSIARLPKQVMPW